MLTDDLICLIAFDAFRTGVPTDDDAVGIEHVEGVVRNTRHQKSELALTVSESVLSGSALGDVAGDLGEALQLSLLVADRIYDH